MTVSSETPPATAPQQPKRSTAARGWWTRSDSTARKAGHRRISQELRALWLDPPAYCRPGAEPVTDPFHWEVVIDGPPGTPYAGGTFPVDVWYPNNYPFRPPKLTFKTKVYHPNIDEEGQMVVDVLQNYWTPAFTIQRLLLCFVSILYDPLLDYPINEDIALQYEYEYELYEKEARAWTKLHSSMPIVSHYLPKAMRTPPAVPHFPATAERRKAAASSPSAPVCISRKALRIEEESLEKGSEVCSGLVSLPSTAQRLAEQPKEIEVLFLKK